jgi:hypothetical protein
MNPLDRFRPRDGAILDLTSLQALAATPDRMLGAWLGATWPGASAVVLRGLELEGEWTAGGPPGTVRLDKNSSGVYVSSGTALLTDAQGGRHLVEVSGAMRARWPTQAGAAVRGVLALVPRVRPASLEGGVAVARDELHLELGFVRPDQADEPALLPLAAAVGNGTDWATDLRRIWQPEHAAIRALLKRFEAIEQTVWQAEPEGAVWDRQILGRNWVRYQTVAASALQAARVTLSTRASSTLERVRLLSTLRGQLDQSVERAATELLQLVGPAEGAGPYRAVIDDLPPGGELGRR